MKRLTLGILAHVDAGKTTLAEAMLYTSGATQRLGRVDKRDAFFDTHSIERERGITVFSKLAVFESGNCEITLVDTPGHVDFFSEAERAISVQDYAILVVSATDGPTPHTVTLFNQLAARRIPTFIFVNKLDIAARRRIDLLEELKNAFGSGVCDFNLESEDKDRFYEECAGKDESLMAEFFDTSSLSDERITEAIRGRRIFPAIFGSALKCEGIRTLLSAIERFTVSRRYSDRIFGAKIYKISTADDGARLTHVKITGGGISAKDTVSYVGRDGKRYEEKIEGIRLYSLGKYRSLKRADAGSVVALVGLSKTTAGFGLGIEGKDISAAVPVLDYKLDFADPKTDKYQAYLKLLILAEEEPSLNLRYDHDHREIKVSLMGEIQAEVFKKLVLDRLGIDIIIAEGSILYKESIMEDVYCAGHFEPLMHYAEVRLKLSPLPIGSGLVFTSECHEDYLKLNWQRLIISHLSEKLHRGVLIGAPITDMRISVVGGRAHPKHTEGGDFREATYRALRQGLMKAEAILLEPTFDFTMELPTEHLGRALTDISAMHGECEDQQFKDDGSVIISGFCPVYTMRYYGTKLRAYTRGAGKLTLSVGEYMPCHNQEEIVESYAYDAELDPTVTADSVFCKGGVGFTVPWRESDGYMHTESPEIKKDVPDEAPTVPERAREIKYHGTAAEDKELMKIFEATYGKVKRRSAPERIVNEAKNDAPQKIRRQKPKGEDYLIVDGYNLIYAWDELASLAKEDLSHARDELIHRMCNYRGFKKVNLILVFDAYRRRENEGSITEIGGITVVYTKERQTADAYIEKSTYSLTEKNSVRVVTSDYEEQLVVLGVGGVRVSAREFIEEFKKTTAEIRGIIGS